MFKASSFVVTAHFNSPWINQAQSCSFVGLSKSSAVTFQVVLQISQEDSHSVEAIQRSLFLRHPSE